MLRYVNNGFTKMSSPSSLSHYFVVSLHLAVGLAANIFDLIKSY
jgi:hypothetical protein